MNCSSEAGEASEEAPTTSSSSERVHKVMARLGLASRRASEEMIIQGRVRINGTVAEIGDRLSGDDELKVDGHVYSAMPEMEIYLLNKPAGVVTTAADPQGRETVVDLIETSTRIFPVGRLDLDSEGLLLLTNDGQLTHRLTHPSFGIDKEYLVAVEGQPSRLAVRTLREGVELDDGMTAPAKVSVVNPGTVKIILHEGRNRQIRRMCDAVGHPVRRLVRTRIGPISDHRLKPGQWRKLLPDEVLSLQRAVKVAR